VTGSCEHGDVPSGFGAMEVVSGYCGISGAYGGKCEDDSFLGYCAM
jgi:hypothetical protein